MVGTSNWWGALIKLALVAALAAEHPYAATLVLICWNLQLAILLFVATATRSEG